MKTKKLAALISAVCIASVSVCGGIGERYYPNNIPTVAAADTSASEMLPTETSNVFSFVYNTLGPQRKSHLIENSDGTFTRVEAVDRKGYETKYVRLPYSKKYCVETYSPELKLLSSSEITPELDYIGGFFSGGENNFVVYFTDNPDKDDTLEVMRVVKYTKDWKRISGCSISDIDTVNYTITPRFTEQDGILYIHTSHRMYSGHQSNMTFAIDEASMKCTQKRAVTASSSNSSYSSHSFDQYVCADEKYLYTLDLGDAYPRAISVVKSSLANISKASGMSRLPIPGETGDNYTGVTLGGFEIAGENLLMTGCCVDLTDAASYDYDSQRNVFVGVVSRELGSDAKIKQVFLTNYSKNEVVHIGAPKLIKLRDDKFLAMWTENVGTTKFVMIDGSGKLISETREVFAPLSDCQPIVRSDGKIMWYFCDNTAPQFIVLDPVKMEIENEGFSASGEYLGAVYNVDSEGTMTVTAKGELDTGVTGTITIGIGNDFPLSSVVRKLVVNEGVTAVGAAFFTEFNAIEELYLPSTLKYIELVGFYRCPSLKKIYLGKNLSYVGGKAFDDCINITDVYYPGTEAQWKKLQIESNNEYFTGAEIHYGYVPPVPQNVKGDANLDGTADIADIVTLKKWILGSGELPSWKNADMTDDGIIDSFDLAMLRRKLIKK